MTNKSRIQDLERRLEKLELTLDEKRFIQGLNNHYYSLQRAFDIYVKDSSAEHESYGRLERAIRMILNRLDDNDEKMLTLLKLKK